MHLAALWSSWWFLGRAGRSARDHRSHHLYRKGRSGHLPVLYPRLDNLGRQYYGDFSNFILLKEEDLGSLKYTEPKSAVSDSYMSLSKLSWTYLKLITTASSKIIYASDHPDWPFTVPSIKVYFTKPMFYFAEIGDQVFALTGATSSHYEIPTYFKSRHLKPKGYALYLLDTAKKLGGMKLN